MRVSTAALITLFVDFVWSACLRNPVGNFVEQNHIYSVNRLLEVVISFERDVAENGNIEYCYLTPDGIRSPVLHISPGDRLRIILKNNADISTNLHFHGMYVSPALGQDEIVITLVTRGSNFTFDIAVPAEHHPGVFWYHPHFHANSDLAVLGGASGMIVVEGLEYLLPDLAGIPLRTMAIRDSVLPGFPGLRPASAPTFDLSVNFVPVPFADYPPAALSVPPSSKELWRVAATCSDCLLNIQLQYDGVPQMMRLVAMDGSPATNQAVSSVLLPGGARVDLVVQSPDLSVKSALLLTLAVDAGPVGYSNPKRPLVKLVAAAGAPAAAMTLPLPTPAPQAGTLEADAVLPPSFTGPPEPTVAQLLAAVPLVTRRIYFSQRRSDPANPKSPLEYYITVQGNTAAVYMNQGPPSVVVMQGSVEDWIVENRAGEVHTFHIHQVHFLTLEVNGVPLARQNMLFQDTVLIEEFSGSSSFPSVKLRMDFTSVVVGTFVYHCHILAHEDAGMMAQVKVVAPPPAPPLALPAAAGGKSTPSPGGAGESSGSATNASAVAGGSAGREEVGSGGGPVEVNPWMLGGSAAGAVGAAVMVCLAIRFAPTLLTLAGVGPPAVAAGSGAAGGVASTAYNGSSGAQYHALPPSHMDDPHPPLLALPAPPTAGGDNGQPAPLSPSAAALVPARRHTHARRAHGGGLSEEEDDAGGESSGEELVVGGHNSGSGRRVSSVLAGSAVGSAGRGSLRGGGGGRPVLGTSGPSFKRKKRPPLADLVGGPPTAKGSGALREEAWRLAPPPPAAVGAGSSRKRDGVGRGGSSRLLL